jgi:osmotically-inducible protein OsmY
MTTHFRKIGLVSAIALAIAVLAGPVAAGTPSQEIIEARQEAQIWTTYALSPYLAAHALEVSVEDGTATLTGTVDDGVNKDLAREIALGVDGIRAVDNRIVVEADYVAPAHNTADRTYAQRIDDATISAAVKAKLMWSKHTEGLTTDVETTRGKVTLTGAVETSDAKDLATRLALNTRGVVAVDNRLVVDNDPADARATEATGQDIADAWITTKVKSTFLYSTNVDSSTIAVSTASGVVTLSGTVASGAERALAIEFAKNVRGVKSVESSGLLL